MPDLLVSGYHELALPLDPDTGEALPDDIEAYDLFDAAGVVEFYGSLVDMLTSAGGYRRASADVAIDDAVPRLYALVYDWRRDLSHAARLLDELIEQVRTAYRSPGLRVDLVAHSSGGLVVRYYLLHGARPLAAGGGDPPDFSGAAKVRSAVAIGVPEIGVARAAASLTEGEPVVLNRVGPEVLATTEINYQFLPYGEDLWLVDAAGRPILADACDPLTWREFDMGVFDPRVRTRIRGEASSRKAGLARLALLERGFDARLGRARDFRSAVRAAPVPRSVRYYSIGGDCRPTQARLLVETVHGRPTVRSRPEDVRNRREDLDYDRLMLEMGDGMVTRASAACRPAWPVGNPPTDPAEDWRWQRFVCASHNQLVVNIDCQRALLHALEDGGDAVAASPG